MTDKNHFAGFSPASARNREPISQALMTLLRGNETVLEVGSGTGQHAVYFTEQWPGLQWQPSDIAQQLPLLQANLDTHERHNIDQARLLNLQHAHWADSVMPVDLIYTANTLHIIAWSEVVSLFSQLEKVLRPQGRVIVYGPFRYAQEFTSTSNAEFDAWLKVRNPLSGLRDFEAVNALALAAGLSLLHDIAMPANNQLLVWQKI
ncbi:DUF938 domain-containing protein [Amphritea sp. 1_MG-2023]|uniref:DUF938 domain-containing protein n=1 Tax=Amphritea sp. 1_MG-2023 TaxID=3062670 RepID=UPI0026E3445C|nr:DUF938 domain-containing protein [Amphritea sp. 1_MG-2023]MDO6563797.1 DUF938 domain-containing protein [Amphritea sp. 1_MG-2023]